MPRRPKLTERELASKAPRALKTPGSVGWCWQTLNYLKGCWESKVDADARWDKALTEVRAYRIWEKVPDDQPYGSEEALVKAEFRSNGTESERYQVLENRPRQKEPGSTDWCWSSLYGARHAWSSKVYFNRLWEEVLGEVRQYQVWEKVPPENPYGSEDAMFRAELGITAAGEAVPSAPRVRAPRQDDASIADACRRVAQHYEGNIGTWAYDAFDYINATFFDGKLPFPLIVWGLTAHGRCLGFTSIRWEPEDGSRQPPIIMLHPSTLGGSTMEDPWGIPRDILGVAYAFDVLIHECMHVSVDFLLGGYDPEKHTSHNNPHWIAEVNRLAPLLDMHGVHAACSKTKRVPTDGPPTKRGKQPTKVIRTTEGNVPFEAVARFPYGVRNHLGLLDYYRRDAVPEPLKMETLPYIPV